MIRLYAAGATVAVVENGTVEFALEESGARCLAVDPLDPNVVYAGTSDEGLFKSVDGGNSWEELSGIEHPRITAVAVSSADGALYAGTEPSSLFVSRDGGASWRELAGMKDLPSAPTWSFPPRPWTSHVRAIATGRTDANLIVAGIELGGIVRSTDGGETWQDQRPGAYPDCHSLSGHQATPNAFYEAAGGGFAESFDSGESWVAAEEGIGLRYVWGLAADREDPELLYVSASSGPGAAHGRGPSGAAIYRRSGPRERWEPVLENLSEFPYALATDPERQGGLYAGLGDGVILHSPDAGGSWNEVARVAPGLAALVAIVA